MENYIPFYPDSEKWADTMDLLTADPYHGEIIRELQEALANGDSFREPVIICEGFTDETGTVWTPCVDSGTHRVVAAYLSGVDSIIVGNWNDEPSTSSSASVLMSRISIIGGDPVLNLDMDCAFCSFRIDDESWLTSDFGSMCIDEADEKVCVSAEFAWFTWGDCRQVIQDLIDVAVKARLSKLFPSTVFTVETWCDTLDDNEEHDSK